MLFRTITVLATILATAPADELSDAQSDYGKTDLALNTLWAKLKTEFPPEQFAKLQQSQRDWISHRDFVADFQMDGDTKGDPTKRMSDLGYLETASGMTEARVAFLSSFKDTAAEDKNGIWTDSYGGRALIVEGDDGTLYFAMSCVRGHSFHVGDISGIAPRIHNLARFTDRDSDPEKVKESGEAWLNFQFTSDGTLKVVSANTSYYHGARAYFDGEYRRTAKLDNDEQTALVKAVTEPSEE